LDLAIRAQDFRHILLKFAIPQVSWNYSSRHEETSVSEFSPKFYFCARFHAWCSRPSAGGMQARRSRLKPGRRGARAGSRLRTTAASPSGVNRGHIGILAPCSFAPSDAAAGPRPLQSFSGALVCDQVTAGNVLPAGGASTRPTPTAP
jgi:hypothetical protein